MTEKEKLEQTINALQRELEKARTQYSITIILQEIEYYENQYRELYKD